MLAASSRFQVSLVFAGVAAVAVMGIAMYAICALLEQRFGDGQDRQGRLLRPLSKSGKIVGDELGDWAIWSVVEQVVEQSSKQIGIEHFGAHDLRRMCAKLCRKNGGGFGADQIPARPLFDPDNRTLSRVGAGYRNRGKRQPRTIGFQSCAPRRKLKGRRRHLSVR